MHVVPRDGRWGVKRAGSERASSLHPTQAEAIKAAREIAKRERSEMLIHGKNGRIRERNTYGKDPFPPPG